MEDKQSTGRENLNSRNSHSAEEKEAGGGSENDGDGDGEEGGTNEGLFTGDTFTNETLQKLEEVFM